MYVIVAVVVILAVLLLLLVDRALKAIEKGRRRREAGMRLYHAAKAALATERARIAAIEASNKLTSVLPVIHSQEHTPRKVA